MASWAWPHTPPSNWACLALVGGPFCGVDAGHIPPDTGAPVQVVWSGWTATGHETWLYEWTGETSYDRGRTDALLFRPVGRYTGEMPPAVATTDADVEADPAQAIARAFDVPLEMVFPGL